MGTVRTTVGIQDLKPERLIQRVSSVGQGVIDPRQKWFTLLA
jgi:hypothetical protein